VIKDAPRPANDNTWEPSTVRTPARGRDAVYARSGNLILPLRFARRMSGWQHVHAASGPR
jgi:hypothetical protein